MNDDHQLQRRATGSTHLAPDADEADAWPEGQPVPYTLTPEAKALLSTGTAAPRRHPARAWALTPQAEALLAAADQPEAGND